MYKYGNALYDIACKHLKALKWDAMLQGFLLYGL